MNIINENPISEAWRENPEWRWDFVKNVLLKFYRPLVEGLVKESALGGGKAKEEI